MSIYVKVLKRQQMSNITIYRYTHNNKKMTEHTVIDVLNVLQIVISANKLGDNYLKWKKYLDNYLLGIQLIISLLEIGYFLVY